MLEPIRSGTVEGNSFQTNGQLQPATARTSRHKLYLESCLLISGKQLQFKGQNQTTCAMAWSSPPPAAAEERLATKLCGKFGKVFEWKGGTISDSY